MANAFCTAGKKALLDAVVLHTWKAALYVSSASLDNTTPAYTSIGEVANGSGYTAGGNTLASAATDSGSGKAWFDFDDVTWPSASFTAHFMLIYDASDSNRAYAVIDFGSDKSGQGGNFTFRFPNADATDAIIRI
jgi:hypothetical protein